MRHHWKPYFLFSNKEQKGIIVLGFVLLMSILISLLTTKSTLSPKRIKTKQDFILFNFDPNKIDSAHALLLGIPPKQINTLMHFRAKGGVFYRKEDLGRWYGLKPELLEKLLPFVIIENIQPTHSRPHFFSNNTGYPYKRADAYTPKKYIKMGSPKWTIDINEADEAEWLVKTHLPKTVVQSVFHYKQYLGGFHSIFQVAKVYGLSDSSFQVLKPHLVLGKNISSKWEANFMNFEQWKSLGIFQDKEVKQILNFKKEHGGKIGWKWMVETFDLTEQQAHWLLTKIRIDP